MLEPETTLTLEAPGGLVRVRASCKNGKAERISIENVPSFVDKTQVALEVEGLGTITVDTAYGGDSFVIVDANALGFTIAADEARDIARMGIRLTSAANDQLGFTYPENPDWQHVSFCLFAGDLYEDEAGLHAKSAVAIQPGKVDRSPTGTALSARMALLHAQGKLKIGDTLKAHSIIGSTFMGRIADVAQIGKNPGIVPEISGRGWITGTHQHMLEPSDPWPQGYKLNDTWGVGGPW